MRYVKILLAYAIAALFLFASAMKFAGTNMEVAAFQKIGFGMWFLYFTAAWELVAAVLIIVKKYRYLGLSMAVLLSVGAFFAQVLFLKEDWIHTVVLGILAAWLAYSDYSSRTA